MTAYTDTFADRTQTHSADEAAHVARSMNVAPVRESIKVTYEERVALAFATFMMLAPLAMAAWGAHHIA
jgi:hypothetical protein